MAVLGSSQSDAPLKSGALVGSVAAETDVVLSLSVSTASARAFHSWALGGDGEIEGALVAPHNSSVPEGAGAWSHPGVACSASI